MSRKNLRKKERAMAQALKKLVRTMGMNLSEEEREQLKQTLLGILVQCDRVSTPEAMDYIDEIFAPFDAVEKALGDAKPADKKVPEVRAVSGRARVPNAHSRRTHGHTNNHLNGESGESLQSGGPVGW